MFYKTLALWGRCPGRTPLSQISNRAGQWVPLTIIEQFLDDLLYFEYRMMYLLIRNGISSKDCLKSKWENYFDPTFQKVESRYSTFSPIKDDLISHAGKHLHILLTQRKLVVIAYLRHIFVLLRFLSLSLNLTQ